MTDKEIFNILHNAIGRETVDRFVENANGDLVGYATVSLEELAKEIDKKVQEEKEQDCKNTAKEILQLIKTVYMRDVGFTDIEDGFFYGELIKIAKKYGVEVDE